MLRISYVILAVLFVALGPMLVTGQEVPGSWLDGEALMLNVLNFPALDEGALAQFHPDCQIAMDSVMARHIRGTSDEGSRSGAPPCREPRHWEGVRRYVREFRMRNNTAARFMRPSGIGAPWMVRYAVRCQDACRNGMVGFEVRFTYDGRRVTRVELQAR